MFSEKISSVTTSDGRVSKLVYDKARKKVKNFSVTLENCLFGAVKLTKNTDIDNYTYTGYGIGFLITIHILDMVLDFFQEELFYIQVEDLAKMLLFLELI